MWIWLTTGLALAQEPLPLQMQGHFADATDAVWFTASGDLEQAQAEAAALEVVSTEQIPKKLAGYAQALQAQAKAFNEASTLPEAADGVGALGMACSACHVAAGKKGPSLSEADLMTLPGDSDAAHSWALYAAWVGVVVGDDRAWAIGMEQMAILPTGHDAEPTAELVGTRYTELVQRGAAQTDRLERASTLADLISTCPACHGTLGVSMTPEAGE